MSSEDLFTRDEVLGGLPAQRARTLLFLIESRAGQLKAQSRRAMERFLTDEAAEERDQAFLEAFTAGKDHPLRPTIQDLERYAPHWAVLVPENHGLKAAIAHLLGEKYAFTQRAVPGIRQALGLDTPAVQQAYERQYKRPLASVYTAHPGPLDRLRWAWASLAGWLESLPPFWTAFALTLTETVGMGILALPIALAGIGPLAGILLLIVLGLVNLVTIAFMAEAVSRSGDIRYGKAYFGRLVANLLGKEGSLILTPALIFFSLLVLLAYYFGFSTTLESATGLPAAAWVGMLFLIDLVFLSRKSLNATISAALLVGAINISIVLALSLLTLPSISAEQLSHFNVPFIGGRPFDPAILQLVFGVVLSAYFGHTSMGNCARVVLRRDPSARALFSGSLAAQLVSILLYSIWLFAVNGSIPASRLAGISSTALIPLAETVGPIVFLLGSIFVILGMGMGSIHFSLGLFNQVQEWLPKKHLQEIVLPRRRGRVIFHSPKKSDGNLIIGLVYLGVEAGQPRFRLDVQAGKRLHRLEVPAADYLDFVHVLERLPQLSRKDLRLSIDVREAGRDHARLILNTSLAVSYSGEWDPAGLGITDLLALSGLPRQIMDALMRQGPLNSAELASLTGTGEREIQQALRTLADRGFVQSIETRQGTRFRALLLAKKGRTLPEGIWQALEGTRNRLGGEESQPRGLRGVLARARRALLGERGRFLIGAAPAFGIFLLVEWLLFTGSGSFSRPLGFLGVVTVSLMGGVFPALLLVASRKKGEYVPGKVYRFLGHPILTIGVYAISLGSLFLHGLVIWQDPLERALALAVGILVLGVNLVMLRGRVFVPRIVLELRQSQDSEGVIEFTLTSAGQSLPVQAHLEYADGWLEFGSASQEIARFSELRSAFFQLPQAAAGDLKVWSHRMTPEGDSEALPAHLEVHCGEEIIQMDMRLAQGQVLIPLQTVRAQGCQSVRLLFGNETHQGSSSAL